MSSLRSDDIREYATGCAASMAFGWMQFVDFN
jgi:hypothetical protein